MAVPHQSPADAAVAPAEPPPPWSQRLRTLARRVREPLAVLAGTPRALGLVWEAHPGFTLLLVAISAIQGLVPLVQVWLNKQVIDEVAAALGLGARSAPLGGARLPSLITSPQVLSLLLGIGLVTLLSQAFDPATRAVQYQLTDYVTRAIQLRILRKANSLVDISFFESPRFYDLLQRAQQDAHFRPINMLNQIAWLLRAVIGLLSMLAVLAVFAPLLALAVVALAFPSVYVQFRHQREMHGLHNIQVPEVRHMNYYRSLLASKDHAKEIRLFGLGDFFLRRWAEKFQTYFTQQHLLRFAQWRRSSALALLAAVGTAGAYAYVVAQALAGRLTIGGLTFYSSAVGQVQGSLSTIIYQVASLYESNLFVAHLFEFLSLQPSMALPPPDRALPVPRPLRQGIEFRHLAFRYPGTERFILEDASFTIRPGQTVALVGANGAGKTTLVKLLSRLYDPTDGQILVDGVDLREYDLEDWRRQSAVVFQDFSRYHAIARENIGFGSLPHLEDLAAVGAAAASGGADAVIAKLPDGYDTILGRNFWTMSTYLRRIRVEEGVDLSGGEWQKVALARAFMRAPTSVHAGDASGNGNGAAPTGSTFAPTIPPGAQLLILDEPTAALDAEAEYEVYQRFAGLTRGRAALLISHRFSTVRMADEIVVLDNGRVIEHGSHDSLMAHPGTYARLFTMQAERYH